jgi:uncharacterized protein involved in exopolysaccharide biosynthesis
MLSDPTPDLSLRALFRRITQRRLLLTLIALIIFTTVAAWTFLATPRYKSTALLRIESKTSGPSIPDALKDVAGAAGGLAGLGKDELDTDIGVLKSGRMADATIDALALMVVVTSPADRRTSVLRARVLDSTDVEGKLTLSRRDDGRYDVQAGSLEPTATLPPSLAPGDSMRVGSVMLGLPESLRANGPATIRIRLLPHYRVRERLDKRLTIRRQEGGSRLVEVSFEDPDRRLAALVIDHLVREYVAYMWQLDERDDSTQMQELRGALASSAVRLAADEEQLRSFQQRERVVLPEEQAGAQVKRIALLDTRVDAVRIERNALSQLLDLIRQRSHGGSDPAAFRQLATFQSLISNRAIQDLLQALIELETKRSQLTVTRTGENAEVQQLTARIVELDAQLYRLGNQYLESLDQQLASTSRTVSSLNDTLNTLPATGMRYARLLRTRTISNEEFLQLTKQLKLAEISDLLRREKVKIVDAPRVANVDDPAFPRRGVQLALGLVLAIVLALTIGLGVELWSESGA